MTRKRPIPRTQSVDPATLRIIGGRLRGSKFSYTGDPTTRPMKERLREAVFNLVGPTVKDKHAVDLFAGTGALGLEALSRGAAQATFIERHRPTAKTLRDNIAALGLADRSRVATSDTFFWARELPASLRDGESGGSHSEDADRPWLVFCSPPYALYHERAGEMLELIQRCMECSPAESIVVVEADAQFDFEQLPQLPPHDSQTPTPAPWNVRQYAPAAVAIWRNFSAEATTS